MTSSTPAASGGRNIFVLSGGGSRGAAQIGMLRALLGAGVVPDMLVGGSVGAINASVLAAEPSAAQVERLADKWMTMSQRALTGSPVAAVSNLLRRRPYLFSADRLKSLITEWVGVDRIEDLPTPVRVATTHLATGKAVHHDSGCLAEIIAASAALPALFPPVRLGGNDRYASHVDAGIAENVPLSGAAAVAHAGDTVYVLDVTKVPLMRDLRNPLDVLIAALSSTVRNQAVPVFATGVQVVHMKLDETYDCGPVFDFSNTGTLFRMGESLALSHIPGTGSRAT